MINVSFLGSSILTALINVLATIAIIVVGAFIIVFLSDLVISIIDGKNGIFFKRDKNNGKEYGNELPNRPRMTNKVLEEPKETETYVKPTQEEVISYGNIDLEEAKREEEALAQKNKVQDEEYDFSNYNKISEPVKPVAAKRVEEPEEVEEDNNNEEYIQEISKRAMELLDEEDEKVEEKEEPEEVVETVVPDNSEEIKKLTAELEEQKAIYEKLLAEKQAEDEEKVSVQEQNKKLQEEKVALEKALEEQKVQEQNEIAEASKVTAPVESLDELNAKLAILEDRLKSNEKLFKANKKEYLPLYRINKSLENDTKKLRRKEASVAKQKVMLYGVNNYVDIDPEKAKELTEELDLLDGLRLSVKHCEDVMASNKDRYPILEQTNKILTKTIEDIKSDIAEVNAKIQAANSNEDK